MFLLCKLQFSVFSLWFTNAHTSIYTRTTNEEKRAKNKTVTDVLHSVARCDPSDSCAQSIVLFRQLATRLRRLCVHVVDGASLLELLFSFSINLN